MQVNSKGFSLIEVLVAAFIMFLVLSTVTITYTGAIKSTISATESLKLYGYVPLLIDDISISVQQGETSGSGSFLNVEYTWKTELFESKEIVSFYDFEELEVRTTGKTAFLWNVLLDTRYNGRIIPHTFSVMSWSE